MNKRIFFITLALVVLITALMPAAALAKNENHPRPKPGCQEFSGTGVIWVSGEPQLVIKGNIWRYSGEIAEGFLEHCDWDLLAGATFWSTHDSFVIVKADGSARGIMKGDFTLTRSDGSVLEGVFEGRISGNLYTGFISDVGTWRNTGGSGAFSDVKAWGQWSADLAFNGVTLVGPLTWEGKYIQK